MSCFQVNVKSLDTVIRFYLNLASQKTEAAREQSHQSCLDIDDLDVIQSPERSFDCIFIIRFQWL